MLIDSNVRDKYINCVMKRNEKKIFRIYISLVKQVECLVVAEIIR